MDTTQKQTFAVLVPAFGQRAGNEPGPCNERLAAHTVRICGNLAQLGHTVVLVTQWEVDEVLQRTGDKHVLIGDGVEYLPPVTLRQSGEYLDTKQVYAAAHEAFVAYHPTVFVAIAQPFIHRTYVNLLASRGGYVVRSCSGIRVGFDPESTQWWCRSWWQLLAYTILTGLGMKRGHAGRQFHA